MAMFKKIQRDRWTDDLQAAAAFAGSLAGKFTAGPKAYNNMFASGAAGTRVSGSLGGGTYSPARVDGSFTAPVVKP